MHSPTSATLLREPLLRSSGSKVTLRIASSTSTSKLPPGAEAPQTPSFLEQLRSLPTQVYAVLLVDFLNSYRSFGFRAVQYQYITNEFGIGDVEAGSLLGVQVGGDGHKALHWPPAASHGTPPKDVAPHLHLPPHPTSSCLPTPPPPASCHPATSCLWPPCPA